MSAPPLTAAALARASAYLHAGQIVVAAEPTAISTVLGSCVAVCLWDEELHAGGVNHYLLPLPTRGASGPAARFGEVAIAELLAGLEKLGAQRRRLVAKLFGGATVLPGGATPRTPLGTQNVAVARERLAALGIPIVAEDVGGTRGRKLIFHTDDGSVWVKLL